jgi:hypothetical protein
VTLGGVISGIEGVEGKEEWEVRKRDKQLFLEVCLWKGELRDQRNLFFKVRDS